MKKIKRSPAVYVVVAAFVVAGLAVFFGACSTSQGPKPTVVRINAAGATFPYPIYSKWLNIYHEQTPGVEINYQAIGSGGGIRQLTSGTVDFGASDSPMTDQQLAEAKTKLGCDVLHFPTVLGGVVPTYNIPGVEATLKFTPDALVGIYLGTIKKWNDPALVKPNPDVKLPGANIVVVHRSDGSGTTYIWTDYLSKVSAKWKNKVGYNTSINWPVGLGGKGNQGVAGIVKQTPDSIGYVELIYALQSHMSYGRVQNASGQFIKADLASVTAAAAGAAQNMPSDFRVSIVNAPGADAYPISSFTWLLIPSRIQEPAKRDAIKGFLKWMLTDGQKYDEALSYAQLPQAVVSKEAQQVEQVQ